MSRIREPLRLTASAAPQPSLLRSAIAAALAGRRRPGPEGEVAWQIAERVRRAGGEGRSWR